MAVPAKILAEWSHVMKQGSLLLRKGTEREVQWMLIAILCSPSVLAGFPTITVYSEIQNKGIPLEGIALESLDAFHWLSARGSEAPTGGLHDTWRYSSLLGEREAIPAWTPRDFPFAPGLFRMEIPLYDHEGSPWLSRWDSRRFR